METAIPHASLTRTSIRPIEREDREPLRQLLHETEVFTSDEIEIALELIDLCLNSPDQEDYIIFTCEADGEVVGYYCVGPTPATEGTFDLYWIAVKPSTQGHGIGGDLSTHAENLVRNLGGRLMIAETSSLPRYDKTRRFYATHGYSELSRIRDYYRVGDDLIVFCKYLT